MTLTREEKRKIRLQICGILSTQCDQCEIQKNLERKYGKATGRNRVATYCNTKCQVGKQLQALSSKLENEPANIQKKRGRKPKEIPNVG